MQKWEYMIVNLEWNKTVFKGWFVAYINGKEVEHENVHTFMARIGEEGWELVSVSFTTQTLLTEGTASYQRTKDYTEFYRLFFKRPKE